MALANGDANYLPPRSARRMAVDLAFLPVWYADDGDAVLIPDSAALYYWNKTLTCGASLPEIKWITDRETLPLQPFSPWGWNPALVKMLTVRGLPCDYLPGPADMEAVRQLSGRQTGAEVLEGVMQALSAAHPLTGMSVVCHTEGEIAREVERRPATMLKAPWSSSGKGLRRGQGVYAPPLSGWCVRTLLQQGSVVVEPLYNKVKDFAMEFYSSGEGESLSFVGYSSFVTDANGAYEGNRLMTDEAIEDELAAFVPRETLLAVRLALQRLIGKRVKGLYCGYIGVDMMICRISSDGEAGDFRLHPCVEVNLRMNMGVVAHIFYERYVKPGCTGRFMVEYFPTPEALREAHARRLAEMPLRLSPEGRICRGYHPLTPVGRETQYLAWASVSEK